MKIGTSSRRPLWAFLTVALPALALPACGPEYAVIPQHGVDHQTASAQGVLVTAFADQWNGDPNDLANLVTPIAVDLYNGTQHEVRVSLADFSLVNEQSVRLPALNPFEHPIAFNDAPAPSDNELVESQDLHLTGTLLAGPLVGPAGSMMTRDFGGGHGGGGGGGHGGGGGGGHGGASHASGGHSGGGHYGAGHYSVGARGGYAVGSRGARWGHPGYTHGPHWGTGFHPYHGIGWWYGPGSFYWGGPWAYGPDYDMWVVGWDNTTGYSPSPDVIEYALPEGVLQAGAHVNGFLYFKKATGEGSRTLTLTWRPHDAQSDAEVGEAHVALDVVKL